MSEVCWVARARSGLESVRCPRRAGAAVVRDQLIARGHEGVRIVRVTVRRGAEAKRMHALAEAADAYREAQRRVIAAVGLDAMGPALRARSAAYAAFIAAAMGET